MKSNDPLSPDNRPTTPAPVADGSEGSTPGAPFSVSEGDFSTPHRRRRTITRPRGLKAIEAPSVSTQPPTTVDEAPDDLPTPPPEATPEATPEQLEASEVLTGPVPTMSAVDEFLASPPTPIPEVSAPAPLVEPAPFDFDSLREDAGLNDSAGMLASVPAVSLAEDALSLRALATEGPAFEVEPAPPEAEISRTPGLVTGATPLPEVMIETPSEPTPLPRDVGALPFDNAPARPATPRPASPKTPTPGPRSPRPATPPPIPGDAAALTPLPEGEGAPYGHVPPSGGLEHSGEAYAETATFSSHEPEPAVAQSDAGGGDDAGEGDRDGSAASGPVPIVENASAGAEMRLAALGADPQIDAAVDGALGVDQRTHDEAMVDDLLRRAAEEMLVEEPAAAPSDVGSIPQSPPSLVPGPSIPIDADIELAESPGAAGGVEPVARAAAEGHASEISSPGLPIEIEPTEMTAEPGFHAISEASLSPLAQTLAHMAEALHVDLTADGGLDIDIVDGPLVNLPKQGAPAGVAVPPPVPSAALATSAGTDPAPLEPAVPEALADRPRLPRRSKPWYEEIFDENYLRTLPFMTAEQTLHEVDFIESSLAAPKGARILDVGCGYGRHAIELVQRGLSVTGLDLSLPLLIRAADEAQRRSLSVNFVHTDMRGLAFDREFDGAYCMLTSFGYFDEESNLKVAEGIARALKPGGRFLLDVVNRDYIVGDLPARIWWEGDGCVVLEEVEFNFNTSRILTHRSVVFEDGRQLDQEISVRAYSLHELGKLFRQTGFRVIDVAGSIYTPGRHFGAASRNLLILAERRRD